MRVSADVDLEDVLYELYDEDILSEVKRRGLLLKPSKDSLSTIKALIDALRGYSCPSSILSQLEDWSHEKVPTREDLDKWLSIANTGGR